MPPRKPSRAQKEATIVLGRDAVEAALADLPAASQYWLDHPEEVEAAVSTIRSFLPHHLEGAIAFAAKLSPELRMAIAGAWAGGAGALALARLGIEEE